MSLTPAARRFADVLTHGFPDPADGPLDVAALRRASSAGPARGLPEVARVSDTSVPGPPGAPPVPVRIYEPDPDGADGDRPLIVFCHGGGWVMCGLDTHDGLCRELASRTGALVVSVDYRRAPEHRFPCALLDAYAVTEWAAGRARELRCDPSRVVVAGDSSGGNLAAAVALMARNTGGPAIAAQLLVYPALDDRLETASAADYATGFFHTSAHMRWYWEQYLGPDGDGADPYASPVRAADLAGLPPALLILPECDPLRDEGRDYAERLREAGVPAEVRVERGMFHGFLGGAGVLPEADAALGAAARWLLAV
ncbi:MULTISPECIES: alpha/beta hydrolase [unclassified Streptomyces]|uniref:alpha/beta hydrolase n=1 Tax=unclassified Streptomyces TaxID=2593676 RepID=UPI002E1FCF7F|nr:alpha/beta hydrolase [Streptomyces sp. NBC_01023]